MLILSTMTASASHREALLDAEIERVMKMTEEELRADMIADGLDPDAEIERMRQNVTKLLDRCRKRS